MLSFLPFHVRGQAEVNDQFNGKVDESKQPQPSHFCYDEYFDCGWSAYEDKISFPKL